MATDFIQLKPASSGAAELGQLVHELELVAAGIIDAKANFDHLATDPDYTKIEAYYQLNAGQGVTLYNLVAAAATALAASAITNLTAQVK